MSGISESDTRRPSDTSTGAIDEFRIFKECLIQVIDEMLALVLTDRQSCLEMKEKLEANTFNLVVVGQFKRGKTCLINALLGANILPTAVVPLTSIVTVLAYGERLDIKVFFNDGKVLDIPVSSLPEYVTESGNPKNAKEVHEVVVLYPSPYLKDGVRLVDTPGVGSVYSHNTDVAYRYLPKSDAALFLMSIDQPVGSAEIEFLNDVREYADRIFFLLNKIDYLPAEEIGRALAFAKETLEQIMGPELKIFPVSAKLALQAKDENSSEGLKQSGLPDFTSMLERFLLKEKGKVLLGSAAKNLLKVLSRARLETELELKSLKTPVEDMREKIKAFENKKAELAAERRSFDVLFRAEIERRIISELDGAVSRLKGRLLSEMEGDFNQFCEECGELSLKDLNDALEGFVRDRIQAEFSAWQELEDEKLARAFDSICSQFAGKVNETIDSLLAFSSQLFSVPFEAVEAESLWTSESSFHYKLKGDTVGLDMLTDSLTQILPKYIRGKWFQRLRDWAFRNANKIILNKRKQHMLEMVEMQAGRLRVDFIEKLDRSASRFRSEIIGKMDSVSSGVTSAIERGAGLRLKGEEEAAKMESLLGARLAEMENIRGEIVRIRESVEKL
ncbi:MAG: dynamin family protein [Syntrophobacteraceae bacterium]